MSIDRVHTIIWEPSFRFLRAVVTLYCTRRKEWNGKEWFIVHLSGCARFGEHQISINLAEKHLFGRTSFSRGNRTWHKSENLRRIRGNNGNVCGYLWVVTESTNVKRCVCGKIIVRKPGDGRWWKDSIFLYQTISAG